MRSPIRTFLDRRDDRRARDLRERLGPGGWLMSWHRVDGASADRGPWLARVSFRECPQTVERRGASRSHALQEALDALEMILGDR